MQPMNDKPVVVISAHTMALGAVRALGEAGIPVFVLHHDPRDMAHVSRHAKGAFPVPPPHREEAAFVQALLVHAPRFRGAMLLPASDDALAAVSRHKALLERDYVVACPDWDVARRFIEKRRTYELAAGAGVPTPITAEVDSAEEAREAAARIGFPLLVKPSQSHLYYDRFHRKMVEVHGVDALVAHVSAARRAGLDVVLQEIVPGPDSDVVNYNAYSWGGRSLVEFTARQLRKAPPRFGSPRVVVSERIEAVLEPGRRTLAALGLEGFSCTELKRDARDGRYKVLDVNGRHNLSGLLAVRCGINFPLLEYRHRMLGELPRERPFTEGVYWTDFFRDAGYSVRHLLEERHAPWAYLAPYVRLAHCDAIFDRDDLRPFVARGRYLATSLVRWLAPRRGHAPDAGVDGPPGAP
jgi:predicted ATP-grasp superfamily ATP-dependent carboligase